MSPKKVRINSRAASAHQDLQRHAEQVSGAILRRGDRKIGSATLIQALPFQVQNE